MCGRLRRSFMASSRRAGKGDGAIPSAAHRDRDGPDPLWLSAAGREAAMVQPGEHQLGFVCPQRQAESRVLSPFPKGSQVIPQAEISPLPPAATVGFGSGMGRVGRAEPGEPPLQGDPRPGGESSDLLRQTTGAARRGGAKSPAAEEHQWQGEQRTDEQPRRDQHSLYKSWKLSAKSPWAPAAHGSQDPPPAAASAKAKQEPKQGQQHAPQHPLSAAEPGRCLGSTSLCPHPPWDSPKPPAPRPGSGFEGAGLTR